MSRVELTSFSVVGYSTLNRDGGYRHKVTDQQRAAIPDVVSELDTFAIEGRGFQLATSAAKGTTRCSTRAYGAAHRQPVKVHAYIFTSLFEEGRGNAAGLASVVRCSAVTGRTQGHGDCWFRCSTGDLTQQQPEGNR